LDKTNMIGVRPTQGTFGIPAAELIVPGDPYRSVLYYRMSKLGNGRMPQFGSSVIDDDGRRLIRAWIYSLAVTDGQAQTVALRREQSAGVKNSLSSTEEVNSLAKQSWSIAGALLLVDSLAEKQSVSSTNPSSIRGTSSLIQTIYTHPDPAIRDLFERFIPEEQRVQRLGGAIKEAEILAMQGSADRGRLLFFQTAGVQCKNCHKISNEGQALGPELTLIGKKLDKSKLLENILEPSKTIDPQFVSHLVETTGGEVHTGLLVRKSDAEVVLKKADGKEVAIPTAEIERSVPQQKSLMPDLLLRDMTLQQAADLLEYLANLK